MTPDSLRDRIAAISRQHLKCGYDCLCGFTDVGGDTPDYDEHLADAVIEALDMGTPCAANGALDDHQEANR